MAVVCKLAWADECLEEASRFPVGHWPQTTALERWIYCERKLMHRGRDFQRVAPDTTNVDRAFLPESTGASFNIGSFWIDERFVRIFEGAAQSSVERYFFRDVEGRKQVLFLVHPMSKQLYSGFLRRCGAIEAFPKTGGLRVSPTSSTRTVLVWPQYWITQPFFVKLSLDGYIGEADRKLTTETLVRSVGISKTIETAGSHTPRNFNFLRETLAIAPNGTRGYGFLVRRIPTSVLSDENDLIPLFSLYSHMREGSLLQKMISTSGRDVIDFLTETLLSPFAKQWTQLVVEEGFIPEPHAQNLLLELDRQGRSTGTFFHRDLEAFFVDFEHRRRVNKPIPADLPAVTSAQRNYSQYRLFHRAYNSLHRYFQGTVLYELDRALPHLIAKLGTAGKLTSSTIEQLFVNELERALSEYASKPVKLSGPAYKRSLKKAIIKARDTYYR